jgi:UDP-N-acetyl-D-mannosaminuronate dehydrogenase
MMQFNKVLVVGLGQLGLPVAKYVKRMGFDTYGYDISLKAVQIAEKTAALKKLLILVILMSLFYVYQYTNLMICFLLK